MRSMSYQAMAHGADTVQFFQLRRSVGGCEKFHGAVIDHVGHEHTRVFREVSQLGVELARLGDQFLGARTPAKVGIIFDWPNYWGLEYASGPTIDLKYVDQIHHYYKELYRRQIDVDMVSLEQDFSQYDLLIAPCLYMVNQEQTRKIEDFVRKGGHFVTTMMSGIVDETDNVHLGGYPGPLKDVLGIWVEEFDALPPEYRENVQFKSGERAKAQLLCDVIHLNDAQALAYYDSQEFYNSYPVVTQNHFENGNAYYVGTMLDEVGLSALFDSILGTLGIESRVLPDGLELKTRRKGDKTYQFLINHTAQTIPCNLALTGYDLLSQKQIENITEIPAFDVKIIVQ